MLSSSEQASYEQLSGIKIAHAMNCSLQMLSSIMSPSRMNSTGVIFLDNLCAQCRKETFTPEMPLFNWQKRSMGLIHETQAEHIFV